jgi:hypothetical protein
MFYFAPEAGTGEKLDQKSRHIGDIAWPVSGTRQPAPETGTRNWLVCHQLKSGVSTGLGVRTVALSNVASRAARW